MLDHPLHGKTRLFVRIIILSGNGCFLFQFLLIPGLIWNFGLYGFLACSVIFFIRTKKYPTNKLLTYSAASLMLFSLTDIIWSTIKSAKLIDENLTIELKIMTYNLSFRSKNLESTCAVIKDADPDILIVQELSPRWSEQLANSIGKNYPYQETLILERSRGMGIYSKYKLSNPKIINNSRNKPYAQIVELTVSNKTVQFINVHLTSPTKAIRNKVRFFPLYHENYQTRKAELKEVNDYAEEKSPQFDCQFLVGDFNTMKYELIFKTLLRNWVNTFDEVGAGFGFSFPNSDSRWPITTIDYIMAKGKAECLESEVLKGGDSDHLAILTKMKI